MDALDGKGPVQFGSPVELVCIGPGVFEILTRPLPTATVSGSEFNARQSVETVPAVKEP